MSFEERVYNFSAGPSMLPLEVLEQAAREIDPNCFMVISQVTEVWGRGFTASKHPGGKNE